MLTVNNRMNGFRAFFWGNFPYKTSDSPTHRTSSTKDSISKSCYEKGHCQARSVFPKDTGPLASLCEAVDPSLSRSLFLSSDF